MPTSPCATLNPESQTLQVPIGAEDRLRGLVDLTTRAAYEFHGAAGEEVTPVPLPTDLAELVDERRAELVERVSQRAPGCGWSLFFPNACGGVQPLLCNVEVAYQLHRRARWAWQGRTCCCCAAAATAGAVAAGAAACSQSSLRQPGKYGSSATCCCAGWAGAGQLLPG